MKVQRGAVDGVVLFIPSPHSDERGFFTRTFDSQVAVEAGLDPSSFTQDSQSRSRLGVIRGLHGRTGRGEAKLVRCSFGAVHDVLVDARPWSPTFGNSMSVRLDDETFIHLYVPPGLLHGFQALTEVADVCYRIDRAHEPDEDVSVRWDDVDLGIAWPMTPTLLSKRDQAAGSWSDLRGRMDDSNSAMR